MTGEDSGFQGQVPVETVEVEKEVEVEIRGYNLSLLDRLARELVRRMNEIRGLTDVKSSTEGGNPELRIRFDREKLATLGLSVT